MASTSCLDIGNSGAAPPFTMRRLLSIEGVECTGKTAVLTRLVELAAAAGISIAVKPEFPRHLEDEITEALSRSIFVSQGFRHGEIAAFFCILYGEALSISQSARDVDLVIADRYLDSIAVYQRRFLRTSSQTSSVVEFLDLIERLASATGLPLPETTIWLDAPMPTIVERFKQREKRSLTDEEVKYIADFRDDYTLLASRHPRFRKVDATQTVGRIADDVFHTIILPALAH